MRHASPAPRRRVATRDAPPATPLDPRIRAAAIAVLRRDGWDSATIERVAEEAGISRVTLWRQGLTKDAILDAMLRELADDYRAAMWPIITAAGNGAERLRRALAVICEVAERHLPLLQVSDAVFHRARAAYGPGASFVEPIARLVRDGADDGSLAPAVDADELAEVLFNGVCWPYVHLRGRHHWSAERARDLLLDLVLGGVAPRQRPAAAGPKRLSRAR